jgi:hypothetical protein
MLKKLFVTVILTYSLCAAQNKTETPAWIATSNNYTNMLMQVQIKHHPEIGSNQGLSEYDAQIAQPTLADEDKERERTQAVLTKLKAALAQEKHKEVQQDLQIVIRKIELQFRQKRFSARPRGSFPQCQRRGIRWTAYSPR